MNSDSHTYWIRETRPSRKLPRASGPNPWSSHSQWRVAFLMRRAPDTKQAEPDRLQCEDARLLCRAAVQNDSNGYLL